MRVPIDSISPHPRNYRGHPPEQIEQIRASVRQFGQYREVVTSSDSVILCGQGVWEALKAEGHETVETHPMDFAHDDPWAEKLLIADNELSKLAIDDEKALAALLADIQRQEGGLSGTGWDDGALDKLIGTLAAEDFAAGQAPIDNTPQNGNDKSGARSTWDQVNPATNQRLVWGDIEVFLEASLYERVKAALDVAYSDGSTYGEELGRILSEGCAACA